MKTFQAGFLLLNLAALQLFTPAGHAATVTSCDEASLRAAMAGGGTVVFACDGVISLSNSLIVTTNLVLDASGRQVVLDGGGSVRVFEVVPGANLSLNHLALVSGRSTNGGAVYNRGTFEALGCTFASNNAVGTYTQTLTMGILTTPGEGGAVWNGGSSALRRCVFNGNRSVGFAYYWDLDRGAHGGAVCNRGQLLISDCLFGTNSATGGNGIGPSPVNTPSRGGDGKGGALYDAQSAVVLNSTFVGNTAGGGAGSPASRSPFIQGGNGGTAFGGAICSDGTTMLTNCTLSGNQGIGGAAGQPYQGAPGGNPGQSFGGGVAQTTGVTVLAFCTLASNSAALGGAAQTATNASLRLFQTIVASSPQGGNAAGSLDDLGYNLSSDATLALTNVGSRTNVDPMLGPLADNSGPTPTMALVPGSPAIDAGASTNAPLTDQRGFPRPVGARSDIGAMETGMFPLSTTMGFTPAATSVLSLVSLEIAVSNPNGIPFTGLLLTNILSPALNVATGSIATVGFTGTVTAVPGTRTIVLSGFSLAPSAGSAIRVPIAANAVSVGTATVASLQSDQFGAQAPGTTATLIVGGPPDGHTDAATDATFTSVTLHGTINPGTGATAVWFEYGTTTNFGSSTPMQALPADSAEVPVSAFLTGLPPASDFFFRVAASNQFGTFRGSTRNFFTAGDVAVCDEAHLRANLVRGGLVRIVCDGVIVLSNTLAILTDTEVDATGYQVSVSGNDVVRVFNISPGVSLTLRNLTITRGRSTNGAGIYNAGTLKLDRCMLTANQAIGQTGQTGANGASAPPHPPAPPADGQPGETGGTGGAASGGALYNAGVCSAFWTTFSSNTVVGGGGGQGGHAGYGNYAGGNIVPGGQGGTGGVSDAGAILNSQDLILSNCCLFGNQALGGQGGSGGGGTLGTPYVGGAGGMARGGGLQNEGVLTLVNTTFASNEALGGNPGPGPSVFAGGAGMGGGLNLGGTSLLLNCTVAGNRAAGGSPNGSAFGASLATTGAVVILQNVILAHPPGGTNVFGPLVDAGHNLSSDLSANFTDSTSLANVDPGLGSLTDAGGPTLSILLLGSSPAIDAGDSGSCPAIDQRGRPRPALSGCDIGAFEVQSNFWLLSFKPVGPQTLRLRGIGLPGASFRLQFSDDLIQWTPSGSRTAGADGLFEFDVATVNPVARFFRTVSP